MTIEIWMTLVAVVIVFALIPGPTVILIVGQAISHERAIRHKIQSYSARKKLNRLGESALIGTGLITSTMQRS